MPIANNNYAKVLINYHLSGGHSAVNVLWYVPNTPPDMSDGQDAAGAVAGELDTAIGPRIRALMGADSTYVGTICHLNLQGVVFTATAQGQSGAGALGGDSLPNNCAAVIQKKTETGGKTGRGRWYIGGIGEGIVDESRLTAGGQLLLVDLATELQMTRSVGGIDYQPCHLSADTNLLTIIGCQPLQKMYSQRRRSLRGNF